MTRKKKAIAKKKKIFGLEWCFEPFQDDFNFFSKRMFGGLAAYLADAMVMVLTESPGDREWRGTKYKFDIWNGILLPTDREHHPSLQEEFPSLVSHPVLGKWLYLPMVAEDFESVALNIGEHIAKGDERFGVVSQRKSPRTKKKAAAKKKRKTKKSKKKKKR